MLTLQHIFDISCMKANRRFFLKKQKKMLSSKKHVTHVVTRQLDKKKILLSYMGFNR